jgi:hypothetical protein
MPDTDLRQHRRHERISKTPRMESEFDDCVDPAAKAEGRQGTPTRSALPERIAQAYRRAAAPVRRMLLKGLLRPVGSLALAAVAPGASSGFLLRRVTPQEGRPAIPAPGGRRTCHGSRT